jgi:exonuclease SbcC
VKLHHLRFAALGPFAAEEAIDLEMVGRSGLFLLEGPTGAGKSTVLDAITFALYGGVAGRAASKDRLHTDFFGTVDPFAELEFSVGGQMYRIRRSPTFERAKKDGSGTTTVNATVRLWRLPSDGEVESEQLISNRVREADDEIRRLLGGLSLEQFCQVVILPQGEFATFLRADADQRRDVLQRLFATDHYQDMENQAVLGRQAANAEMAGARQQLRDATVSLAQALGTQIDDGVDIETFLHLPADAQKSQVEQIRASVAVSVEAAALAERTSREAADGLERRFVTLSEQHEIVDRRLRLQSERDQLADAAVRISELVNMRDRAVRVGALAPMFDQRDEINAKVADSERRASALGRLLSAESVESLGDEPSAETVVALTARLRSNSAELGTALTIEKGIEGKSAELARVTADSDRLEIALEDDQTQLKDLPVLIGELVDRRDRCRASASRIPDLLQLVADGATRLQAWQQLDALADVVRNRQDDLRASIDAAQAAIDDLQAATTARLAGMAGELAALLNPGEPCEVCGSREHPAPAIRRDGIVAEDQLTELQERVAAAGQAREQSQAALNAAIGDRENCRARAGENDPTSDLALHESELAEATQSQDQAMKLDEEIERTQATLTALQGRISDGRIEFAKTRQRADQLTLELTADREVVQASRGSYPSVAERCAVYEQQATAAEEWARALTAVREARQQLAELDASIVRAARDAGCADAQEARQSIRSSQEQSALDHEIAAHESAVAINTAALAQIQVVEAKEELADLDQARAARDDAREQYQQAQKKLASLTDVLREVDRCADAVVVAGEHITNVSERTSAAVRVADAVTGQASVNQRRMTLSTYVLRERFASVVDAASRRLHRMSGGRYVLERDEAVSGNKRAGLGLVVLDQWTGGRRDPRTLSGGESFYTSLSLALGLADVVRDEVGGVELETLFIDEGFGSLDPEALESVLEVIDSLRDGGRVVGVVSHVTELKDRISERIEIRRRADGTSSVTVRSE